MNKYLGNTVDSLLGNAISVVTDFGRAALHTAAPNDFEYYMCSLELIDSAGTTKGFMTFAVMPNNISESKTQIASITKTNRGITTVFNDSFVPRDISIQGSFGRKIRLLAGVKEAENVGSIPFFGGNMGVNPDKGGMLVKTGYGLIKMLSKMVKESYKLDEQGNPCIMIFNNYALNTHYAVEILQDSYNQGVENNMIWYYSLEMKAVAPAKAVKRIDGSQRNAEFLTNVAAGAVVRGISNILTDVKRTAESYIWKQLS